MGRNLLIGDKVRVGERVGSFIGATSTAYWVFFDEGPERHPTAFPKSDLTYAGPLRRTAWEHLVLGLDETV
jgi:hypothetical protein